MSDLISRQAALNELPHANWGKEWDEALAKAIIESVPTATIYGFPLDALACVAEIMHTEGITAREVADGMLNIETAVGYVRNAWMREVERAIGTEAREE